MKTAVYIRVSSESQDTEMQRTDLIKYCKAYGYKFDIFEEKVSGSRAENRPELQRMLTLARSGTYDRLLIWKLDRLARSVRDLANILADLDLVKCSLTSFKEHLDLSTPAGKLMVSILSGFAEFELATLKERQKSGIASAQARGVRFGQPHTHSRDAVKNERAKGYSWEEVARRLKISRAQMYRIRNEIKKR